MLNFDEAEFTPEEQDKVTSGEAEFEQLWTSFARSQSKIIDTGIYDKERARSMYMKGLYMGIMASRLARYRESLTNAERRN